jgi:hypothetical protein
MGIRARRSGGCWRQWTEEEGRAALEELARSGEGLVRFAQSRGISTGRLAYWKKRLGEAPSDPPAFVEVPLSAAGRGQIEIAHDGVVVRVREDLDVEHLARIVEALGRRRRVC